MKDKTCYVREWGMKDINKFSSTNIRPKKIENSNVEIMYNASTTKHKRSTTNQYVSIKATMNMVQKYLKKNNSQKNT